MWDIKSGSEMALMVGHAAPVSALALTPDGKLAASGSADHTIRVWSFRSFKELLTLTGHTDRVNHLAITLAITPDGQRIVSASRDQTLKVWHANSGLLLLTFTGHVGVVNEATVTPDGRRVISISSDHALKVWNIENGEELLNLEGFANEPHGRSVAVMPDCGAILAATGQYDVKLLDLMTGQEWVVLVGHSSDVNVVEVTSDGKRAVTVSRDHTLKVWDLGTGSELLSLITNDDMVFGVWSATLTLDGRFLVTAAHDQTLTVWHLETGSVFASFSSDSPIFACDISPEGNTIIAGSMLGNVHILRLGSVV